MDTRASDRERDQVVARLTAHAVEGRLDDAELEERVAEALVAKTTGELAELEADLPIVPRARWRLSVSAVFPRWRPCLAMMALLVIIWFLTGAGYFWPVWPALLLGVALLRQGSGGRRWARHRGGRRHGLWPPASSRPRSSTGR